MRGDCVNQMVAYNPVVKARSRRDKELAKAVINNNVLGTLLGCMLGGDVNQPVPYNHSLLMVALAASPPKPALIRTLLQHGADVVNRAAGFGVEPIETAIRNAAPQVCFEVLWDLLHAGAIVTYDALTEAAWKGNAAALYMMIGAVRPAYKEVQREVQNFAAASNCALTLKVAKGLGKPYWSPSNHQLWPDEAQATIRELFMVLQRLGSGGQHLPKELRWHVCSFIVHFGTYENE